MNLAITSSILAGKLISKLTKLGGNGGTALPGLVSTRLNPKLLSYFSKQITKSSVLITGTNGKTTTSRTLGTILATNQMSYVHNRAGSNLLRGITTAFLEKSNWDGKVNNDYGIFEVDEFVLPQALEQIKTKVVVINNLFRDQLDRYGEIETVWSRWDKSVRQVDKETFLVLNADDPNVSFLGKNTRAKVLYYGIEDPTQGSTLTPDVLDAQKCRECGTELDFEVFYASHMGVYQCPKCHLMRPHPHVSASNIKISGVDKVSFDLSLGENTISLSLPLGGIFNIYNILAAVTVAASLGLDLKAISLGLSKVQPVFGRGEKLQIDNKNLYIALVKNPSGFNEVLKLLSYEPKKKHLLIIINDLIADGRDVSWLWDVDFEKLKDTTLNVTLSGLRAADLALRLKYAHLDSRIVSPVQTNIAEALRTSLEKLKSGETLYVLPTYTAMLQLRKELESKGLKNFSLD
ncbi:MAG: hypothetical protein A3F33_03265 [Candidatus Woykebacteria bacterium RIFCSPHIGHO2_12_FULL_43_10]|uniref:Lipid II isoglutaminyl synthase (glutamine-hydrolyzing) subunit MurT n=2 Tax=Candidatus Woykeibacteriota TaxID=1817899 RepID=A0A1G1WYK5_9BACT|nr:MAG: hypothetical protein A3F33_03265 [Candidatus Woykebacteria bacterium RIFCSPHIGHO2_12_FULL_43_10]OGY29933.1 MAG: hypothetical protein A3J50_01840 [Candidatus Woykebacteria bacterium RIFCSPHIGHO2_02_FULL_43_16b]OGY32217.1 MAG: hypothetical protein A3A61_01765 [Candidatus Woykebacteria bacterium RIFCSPLOWO2_01_FULL_43_14]